MCLVAFCKLKDKDAEIPHYAASAIVEIKKEFDLSLQEMAACYEKNESDYDLITSYIDTLKGYINSNLLDVITIKKYTLIYVSLLEKIIMRFGIFLVRLIVIIIAICSLHILYLKMHLKEKLKDGM